jgi:uncharacterized protein (DUF58 family)
LDPDTLARITRLELRAQLVVEGFISGLHRSPYHGYSIEFAAHREYVPGDDTRHIDWRLYARGDRLYVKQYEEDTNLRTHVLLDCSSSMGYPDQPRADRLNKFQYAATLAASLIYLLMNQQDACGLTLFDQHIRDRIPPTSSASQLRAMIGIIENQQPADDTDTVKLLAEMAELARQRSLIVLISDLLTDPERVQDRLEQLRHNGHDVIVLHVLDHDELTFPFDENTQFMGMESPQADVLVDPQSLKDSYLELVQAFIRQTRANCLNQRIDYKLLSTKDPVGAGLASFLAARMKKIARSAR